MRESGELCCIEIVSDYMYVWDVRIVRGDADAHIWEGPVYSYDDLNEAISVAHAVWKGTYTGPVRKFKRTCTYTEAPQ